MLKRNSGHILHFVPLKLIMSNITVVVLLQEV